MEEADEILLLALRNSGCAVPEEVYAHTQPNSPRPERA